MPEGCDATQRGEHSPGKLWPCFINTKTVLLIGIFYGGLRRAMRLRACVLLLLSLAFAIASVPPPALAQSPSDAEITALKQHGFELFKAGKYAEALPVAKQYAELIQKRYGTAHSEYAIALYYIAEVLRASNRITEAEPLYREALAIGEKSLGADDPKLADRLGHLADIYRVQARFSEAEPLLRRALKIDEASFGPGHPNVAIRLNNLVF